MPAGVAISPDRHLPLSSARDQHDGQPRNQECDRSLKDPHRKSERLHQHPGDAQRGKRYEAIHRARANRVRSVTHDRYAVDT